MAVAMTPYVIRTEKGRVIATSEGVPTQENLAMFAAEEGEPVRCMYERGSEHDADRSASPAIELNPDHFS